MRKTYIVANWKMNKTAGEARDFLNQLLASNNFADNVISMICPPSLYLTEAVNVSQNSPVAIACQNMNDHKNGAFTGEISATMLKSIHVNTCLIGHSERRQYYGETNEVVNTKIALAREQKITPLVCIGETASQREAGRTEDVLLEQLETAFQDNPISLENFAIIAYEPIWAIGTGLTATPEMAQEVHEFIRNWLRRKYTTQVSATIPILYGGSVKPANISELLAQTDIDGGLIGGASLDIMSYIEMVAIATKKG